MFGHREHLIAPYAMGYEGTGIESLYPSNTDMMLKAKAQGATTAYVHSFYNGDPLDGNLGGAKGFVVDAALAAADAVEWSTPQDGWPPVYAVWSNGIRATVVGGEDSISSLHATPLVGSMRTYVRTPDGELTMDGWFQGIRDGRSFVSSGPLIEFTVDGRGPGEQLDLDGPAEVHVRGRVWGVVPMERVELVVDGDVVAHLGTDRRQEVPRRRRHRGHRCERVDPPAGRGRPRGPLAARHVVSAGVHQPGLGDGRGAPDT